MTGHVTGDWSPVTSHVTGNLSRPVMLCVTYSSDINRLLAGEMAPSNYNMTLEATWHDLVLEGGDILMVDSQVNIHTGFFQRSLLADLYNTVNH